MKICEPAGTRAMRRERVVRDLRDILPPRFRPTRERCPFKSVLARAPRWPVERAMLLVWCDGPKVNGTLAAAASNAHDFLRLPAAHVMPMRDDAGARVELAQQFWPEF